MNAKKDVLTYTYTAITMVDRKKRYGCRIKALGSTLTWHANIKSLVLRVANEISRNSSIINMDS